MSKRRIFLTGFAVAIVILLAGRVLAVQPYHQEFKETARVNSSGSAGVTFVTVYYSPPQLLNETKALIKKNGIQNITKQWLSALVGKYQRQGIYIENASLNIVGYNSTGPLKIILKGTVPNFAKYYSYDGVWEISLDVLRISELSTMNIMSMNETIILDSYFNITLPKNARVIKVPKPINTTVNGSRLLITVSVKGNVVLIHSYIYLRRGISYSGIEKLFGKPHPFVIQYVGPKGVEHYQNWTEIVDRNLTINGNITFDNESWMFLSPQGYLLQLRMQLAQEGLSKVEEALLKQIAQEYSSYNVSVLRGSNATVINLGDPKKPLIYLYHLILANYTRKKGGVYVFYYHPQLGFEKMSVFNRVQGQIKVTETTRIRLKNGEFTGLPKNLSVKLKGGYVEMRIKEVSKNELLITSRIFIPYGMTAADYKKLMEEVPSQVEFSYKLQSSKGVCGPAAFLLLLLPFLWIQRVRNQ